MAPSGDKSERTFDIEGQSVRCIETDGHRTWICECPSFKQRATQDGPELALLARAVRNLRRRACGGMKLERQIANDEAHLATGARVPPIQQRSGVLTWPRRHGSDTRERQTAAPLSSGYCPRLWQWETENQRTSTFGTASSLQALCSVDPVAIDGNQDIHLTEKGCKSCNANRPSCCSPYWQGL